MIDFSLDFDELIKEVAALTMDDFYKSMTTYEDHTRWHKEVMIGKAWKDCPTCGAHGSMSLRSNLTERIKGKGYKPFQCRV
jgi:hypothetical protein